MGQYYIVVNFTKRVYFHSVDDGCNKLMEFSYQGTKTVNALTNLIKNAWNGDEVAVLGDYADSGYINTYNNSDTPVIALQKYAALCNVNLEDESLYNFVKKNFLKLTPENDKTFFKRIFKDPEMRYIVNSDRHEYVDLNDLPMEYYTSEGQVYVDYIAPLPLLLAIGNGMGGGDYDETLRDADKVGLWTTSSSHLFLTNYKEDLKYNTNLNPFFYEGVY